MNRSLLATLTGLLCIAGIFALIETRAIPVKASDSTAVFDSNGRLKLPVGYRRWTFVGAPLTPDGLNGGKAGFPEYHLVYIEERNVDAYLKTGTFPDGTVIVKELTRVLDPTFPDGSRAEPSGRGYFNGTFNGLDVTVKDRRRFAKTNGWGFFNFGHHALPYEQSAAESPASECAGCHMAFVAKTDMTWVQFYPILRAK
jgi:cytochrome P460